MLIIRYTLIIAMLFPASLYAQEKQKQQTFTDSIRHTYLEHAFEYPLYSRQRAMLIDSGISFNPSDSYLWQQRAMPLFKQGKYEAGMVYLDKAVELNPAQYLNYRAFMKCIFQKSYNASKADFFLCKQTQGNSGVMDHPYDFYIGLCCLQLNQFDSAELYFTKCIDEKRQRLGEKWVHYVHYFYRGVTEYEKGNYDSAISDLSNCIAIYPNFSDAKYYKAVCLNLQKKNANAIALLTQAVADSKAGYTINEDNAIYEPYPYQIKTAVMEGKLSHLQELQQKH